MPYSLRALLFGAALITGTIAPSTPLVAQAIPIITFPDSAGLVGNFDAWLTFGGAVSPGQTSVVASSTFSATIAQNPTSGYAGSLGSSPGPNVSWSTPTFFGGYQLTTTNNTDGLYLPNFVRGVVSPSGGEGYASLPVTQILAFSQNGTVTNTISGAFVTPTAISDGGTFHVDLPGISLTGATASFRGVVYDGTHWLVTTDAPPTPGTGVSGVDITTLGGWSLLDTTNYTVGAATNLTGAIQYSGIWFEATKTAQPISALYNLTFSDVTYSAASNVPDGENMIGLILVGFFSLAAMASITRRADHVKREAVAWGRTTREA